MNPTATSLSKLFIQVKSLKCKLGLANREIEYVSWWGHNSSSMQLRLRRGALVRASARLRVEPDVFSNSEIYSYCGSKEF